MTRQSTRRQPKRRTVLGLAWLAGLLLAGLDAAAEDTPERVVLVVIDGLHVEAPDRLGLRTLAMLSKQGTSIRKVTGIMPYHPAHGDYAEVHTCSFPNPMMMAGTIFLSADQKMLQHSFEHSAFVANSRSYQSITDGYEIVVQRVVPDAVAVDYAIAILREHDMGFVRIHLQDTGNGGSETLEAGPEAAYRHDIWHEDSPYVSAAVEADRQVGRLIGALERLGRWESTLFIVTADHGQTRSGWHPSLPEESWTFPAVLHGPGIRKDHVLASADQTDIVPTIAHVMNVELPNSDGGSGRVVFGALAAGRGQADEPSKLRELNGVLARYALADARMLLLSQEHPFLNSEAMGAANRFYGYQRVMEWSDLGSIDALVRHNEAVVSDMEASLAAVTPP